MANAVEDLKYLSCTVPQPRASGVGELKYLSCTVPQPRASVVGELKYLSCTVTNLGPVGFAELKYLSCTVPQPRASGQWGWGVEVLVLHSTINLGQRPVGFGSSSTCLAQCHNLGPEASGAGELKYLSCTVPQPRPSGQWGWGVEALVLHSATT